MSNAKAFDGRNNPHTVLLGAGASLAALPNGDRYGRKLPLMSNFISVVDGLEAYLERAGICCSTGNIETLYADLAERETQKEHLAAIESIISEYFASLVIPDELTLYDHLVLSLCPKDMIATFNWDPFLMQALTRVGDRIGFEYLPRFAHLHGSVAEGYCDDPVHDGKMIIGHTRASCDCGNTLKPTPLLYPIRRKDYSGHPAIRVQWKDLRTSLQNAYLFTIFGYSAPVSDAEAVRLLKDAWGEKSQHPFDLVEVVDVADKRTIRKRWEPFMPASEHHFGTRSSWYGTWLASHPRRSCEDLWSTRMQLQPKAGRPIPRNASWDELCEWVQPLL